MINMINTGERHTHPILYVVAVVSISELWFAVKPLPLTATNMQQSDISVEFLSTTAS